MAAESAKSHVNGDSDPSSDQEGATSTKQSTMSKLGKSWVQKTGIDGHTAKMMVKGAVAPAIAMSAYQSTAWSREYSTIGYLVIIISILSVPTTPRAKFVQNMLANVLAVCIVCCVVLLAMYCGIRARIGADGPEAPGSGGPGTSGLAATGAQTAGYSSSASAVVGVWLFVLTFAVSAVRANYPQFMVPCILASIFVDVGMVYAPQFSTMAQAISFATRLLEAMLTGFAIATGVSLFIFPVNSREVAFNQMRGYIASLRGCVAANMDYVRSNEDSDMFAPHRINTAGEEVAGSLEAAAFKAKIGALTALHANLSLDLTFAKREIAFGKLGPDDIQAVFRHLRAIMVPMTGLGSLSDMFQRLAAERGWDRSKSFAHVSPSEAHNDVEKVRIETMCEWHELMRVLREPFGNISTVIDQGLAHVAVILEFEPLPKEQDVEADGGSPRVGSQAFREYFNQSSREFLSSKRTLLKAWCELHQVNLPPNFFDEGGDRDVPGPEWLNDGVLTDDHRRLRRQLFLCLHMEFLLYTVSRRVYDMIVMAESLQSHGKLGKKRIVVPGYKRVRKWMRNLLQHEGEGQDRNIDSSDIITVNMGAAYRDKKDPEHLPPEGWWERTSDHLRTIAHFFASPASVFGFRVACAVMSLGIINYLHDTQSFFTRNRLFWAMIMTSISMSPSAGQSLNNFLLRCCGTIIFYPIALICYYIVDGHTAGVIVFFALFAMIGPYILIKHPAYRPIGMLGPITLALIIGYELQVKKIGVELATSNGQAYHPIYILGLVRVATVCGGTFVAWVFTVFPYPITEHSQLRQNLGRSFYLLANYYSIMHETFRGRLRGDGGDVTLKHTPAYKLEKARLKVFAKTTVLLGGLRAQMGMMKFDLPVGGKFPKQQYGEIVGLLQSMLSSMALVSIASESFSHLQAADPSESTLRWIRNLRRLVNDANVTSQSVTTLLALISASITGGQALPPYLKLPEPALLAMRLDQLDKDILSVRHIVEPGYAAFAVTQICARTIVEDLHRVLDLVREIVGELDFSFHIVSTSDASSKSSQDTLALDDVDNVDARKTATRTTANTKRD